MIRTIAVFEIKNILRRLSTYIYFAVFFALAFVSFIAMAGAFPNVAGLPGSGGKVMVNSPFLLHGLIAGLSYYGLLVTAAVMGHSSQQDFLHNTYPLFFTAPIGKLQYLAGRFIAAMVVLLFIFTSIALGCLVGSWMPFVDAKQIGENQWLWYVQPMLVGVLPNVLFTGSMFFALAALSRKMLPVYVSAVVLLVGYLIAAVLGQNLESKALAGVIDPFGNFALEHVTKYWTVSEKNTQMIPLAGVYLWNRLLWITVGAAVLALTCYRFRFAQGGESARGGRRETAEDAPGEDVALPVVAAVGVHPLTLLPRLAWLELRHAVRSLAFLLITLCGVAFIFVAAQMLEVMFGTTVYPVTAVVVELTGGTFGMFMLIIVIVYSGQMVWREREAGMHELFDALPAPTWLAPVSKLLALMLLQGLMLAVLMLCGITVQAMQGYYRFEPGVYLLDLFGIKLIDICLMCALAMFVQVVVNHKYIGHFVMVLYFVASTFAARFGLEHHLYRFPSHPPYTYSDMNGFGHFLTPIVWFDLYWATFAVLLAIAASLLWVRGLEARAGRRLALAVGRLTPPLRLASGGVLVALVALGGFIFYNTNVLNHYRTRSEGERGNVAYEKNYKKHQDRPQPRITAAAVAFDLFPSRRSVRAAGSFTLENLTSEPIDRVFVNLPLEVTLHRLAIGSAEQPSAVDRQTGFYTISLSRQMAAGETRQLEFDLEYSPRGFKNSGPNNGLAYNGTFINNSYLPNIGYAASKELTDNSKRRKYGLKSRPRMAKADDLAARRNTYASSDADWIDLEVTVSTTADQIAVAPGSLQEEWTEGGRRYFRYKSDGPILNFYSVLSARYEIHRDKWNEVDIEIYYHKGHEYNLDSMVDAIKQSLDYYTANFSPYQHRQVRIVEFPRYQRFAQAFPGTVPYSEGIGFIARVDPEDERDIDYPFYVTAHEVAHQWWAHQVIGGNVQGATMLSETLAQYSALMVMKHRFGEKKMQRFLRHELESYLMGRSVERSKEVPLALVENQPYIHYNKGSLVMYALQDYIGEDQVNKALADYIDEVAFQNPPYTVATDLVEHFRRATPPNLQYLIEDMFETITLFDNRAISAGYTEQADGQYEVRLRVSSKKLRAGGLGAEKNVRIDDLIDVGVLDAEGNYLYLEKHRLRRRETEIVISVEGLPDRAGIDPLNKLIDRKPTDNLIRVEPAAAD